jgi:hypothetical protein
MKAIEELTFTVEHWSDDGNSLVEVLTKATNHGVAVAAFNATRTLRPSHRIRLRQRARIILDTTEQAAGLADKGRDEG